MRRVGALPHRVDVAAANGLARRGQHFCASFLRVFARVELEQIY
jgi:hypothetical protein